MFHRPKCKIKKNYKTLFPLGKLNVGVLYKVGVGSLAKCHWASALELHPDSLFFVVLLS